MAFGNLSPHRRQILKNKLPENFLNVLNNYPVLIAVFKLTDIENFTNYWKKIDANRCIFLASNFEKYISF